MRLLNQAHKTLLDDVRGKHKQPGSIRKSQNWIGGSSLTDAYFIPPHYESVPELLSDLEKFAHNGTLPIPHLIKAAILHYQFETIHPYLDGNGRIGRLLIVLYLVDKNLLRKPTLYISDFFEKNRGSYYDALTLVRNMNDMDQWIRFFLVAVAETAKHSTDKLIQIIHLKQALTEKLLALGSRASKANELLLFLFSKPVVDYDMVTRALAVTHPTANRLLADFQCLGILVERTGFKKNRVYSFQQYLDIFTK